MKTQNYERASASFLSIPEVKLLLSEVLHPENMVEFIGSLFAGLRRTEAESLVSESLVMPSGSNAIEALRVFDNSRRLRLVPMCPAFRAWLAPLRSDFSANRPSCHWRRMLAAARARGLCLSFQTLRNTYAAYRLSATWDWHLLAGEMGWTAPVFARSILLPASKSAAEEFFRLTPDTCGRPQWTKEVMEWRSKRQG